MKPFTFIPFFDRLGNIVELLGLTLMLILALVFQIVLHELPCPLCLLQRLGFLGVGFGLLLNLKFGMRPSHYAIVLLSALFTSFVALRQVALHAIPGTAAYGDPVFGLHLYTWSFIICMVIVIGTTILLGMDHQYRTKIPYLKYNFSWLVHLLFIALIALTVANILSVWFECGLESCPENPTHYYLFRR